MLQLQQKGSAYPKSWSLIVSARSPDPPPHGARYTLQVRHLEIPDEVNAAPVAGAAAAPGQAVFGQGPLLPEQAILVQQASTFFVASYHEAEPDDSAAVRAGCDVSHRGGAPGFVQIDAPGDRLRWGDFAGNNFFQTLGECKAGGY